MPDVTTEALHDDAARHGVGANNPPDPIVLRRSELQETHAALIARTNELLGLADRLPVEMSDEWEVKITEAIKSCTKFSRNCEVTRLDANEPYRALIAATDGFFKALSDKVDALKAKMTAEYLTPFQQEKAATKKRRLEEEARATKARAAEEERVRREEAARLEEARRAEEAAKQEAARIERERKEEKERRDAEARREIERAEEAKREARRQEVAAREKKDREAAEVAKAAKAKADQEIADAKAKRDREAAEAKAEAERKAAEAKAVVEKAAAERRDQVRVASEATDRAAISTQRANVTGRAAQAKTSELSRTRTDLGAIASLRTEWKYEVVSAKDVPRLYLSVDESAIAAAVQAAITPDGKCPLKISGVRIYAETNSVVR